MLLREQTYCTDVIDLKGWNGRRKCGQLWLLIVEVPTLLVNSGKGYRERRGKVQTLGQCFDPVIGDHLRSVMRRIRILGGRLQTPVRFRYVLTKIQENMHLVLRNVSTNNQLKNGLRS